VQLGARGMTGRSRLGRNLSLQDLTPSPLVALTLRLGSSLPPRQERRLQPLVRLSVICLYRVQTSTRNEESRGFPMPFSEDPIQALDGTDRDRKHP